MNSEESSSGPWSGGGKGRGREEGEGKGGKGGPGGSWAGGGDMLLIGSQEVGWLLYLKSSVGGTGGLVGVKFQADHHSRQEWPAGGCHLFSSRGLRGRAYGPAVLFSFLGTKRPRPSGGPSLWSAEARRCRIRGVEDCLLLSERTFLSRAHVWWGLMGLPRDVTTSVLSEQLSQPRPLGTNEWEMTRLWTPSCFPHWGYPKTLPGHRLRLQRGSLTLRRFWLHFSLLMLEIQAAGIIQRKQGKRLCFPERQQQWKRTERLTPRSSCSINICWWLNKAHTKRKRLARGKESSKLLLVGDRISGDFYICCVL